MGRSGRAQGGARRGRLRSANGTGATSRRRGEGPRAGTTAFLPGSSWRDDRWRSIGRTPAPSMLPERARKAITSAKCKSIIRHFSVRRQCRTLRTTSTLLTFPFFLCVIDRLAHETMATQTSGAASGLEEACRAMLQGSRGMSC